MQSSVSTSSSRFLTFTVDEQLYALRAQDVTEVIRVPELAKVPQGPPALLGIANLRGSLLPVAGLREILGATPTTRPATQRAIILDIGAPAALVVDSVANLESVSTAQLEASQKELSAQGAEKLLGAFSVGAEKRVAKILDIKALLEAAFSSRSRAKRQDPALVRNAGTKKEGSRARTTEVLVTFEVAGQEFALPLEVVQEILPLPASISALARPDTVVLASPRFAIRCFPSCHCGACSVSAQPKQARSGKRSLSRRSALRRSGWSPTGPGPLSLRTSHSLTLSLPFWPHAPAENRASNRSIGASKGGGSFPSSRPSSCFGRMS